MFQILSRGKEVIIFQTHFRIKVRFRSNPGLSWDEGKGEGQIKSRRRWDGIQVRVQTKLRMKVRVKVTLGFRLEVKVSVGGQVHIRDRMILVGSRRRPTRFRHFLSQG